MSLSVVASDIPPFFEYYLRTRVVFGLGTIRDLGFEAGKLGGKRAFVVTDQILRQVGLLDQTVAGLTSGNLEVVGVFDAVPPNSEVRVVEAAAAAAQPANPDLIVALGGGSVMDTAKAMNMILVLGGNLLDQQGVNLITRPLLPLVAIPTTAGTGSEVSAGAVIKDAAQGLKLEFTSPYLMPDLALLDPEMTRTMPPAVTAATGMDALSHAIEAYLSNFANTFSNALALEAIRLIVRHLPQAVAQGDDLGARSGMAMAACLAGIAMTNAWLGMVHALAHACGGRFDVTHGVANAIFLPFGMRFNQEAVPERFLPLAEALGVREVGLSLEEAADRAIAAVQELREQVGLPARLRQVGVDPGAIPQLAEDALGDGLMVFNARPATADDLMAILEEAY